MDLITCSKCGILKFQTDFYKNGKKLRPDCKECVKFRQSLYYQENKEKCNKSSHDWSKKNPEKRRIIANTYSRKNSLKISEYSRMYRKIFSDKYNESEKAKRMKQKSRGYPAQKLYYQNNKRKVFDQENLWRKNNWHKISPKVKNYRKDNKDRVLAWNNNRRARVLKAEGTFSRDEWIQLKSHYNYQCLRCGQYEPAISLTMDHVIPLSAGGQNCISNIQPLCLSCNCSKGIKIIDYR